MSVVEEKEANQDDRKRSTFDAFKPRSRLFRVLGDGAPHVSRRVRPRGRTLVICAAAWVGFILILAVVANWLPIASPIAPIGVPNALPHWGHEFLGLDAVGRSMVSRIVYGARTSYLIAIFTTAVAMAIGCTIGLLAVYFRGTINFFADLLCNVILSIPGLLLLLTLAMVLKPSVEEIIGAISLVLLPGFIRLTRAIALSQIEREYVMAARALGASVWRIIVHELLPSTLTALVTYAGIVLPAVMLIEGGLSYLGYGVPAPTPSWGEMIALGQQNISQFIWPALIPAITFAVNIFALYTLGDWLRAKVDLKGIDKTT